MSGSSNLVNFHDGWQLATAAVLWGVASRTRSNYSNLAKIFVFKAIQNNDESNSVVDLNRGLSSNF